MRIRFEERSEFSVYGYAVETVLSSAEKEVGQLWEDHEESLLNIPEGKSGLYGVMWYTENHRYYYLLGAQGKRMPKEDMTAVIIPAAYFAIATVPNDMDIMEAWTQYFEKELPQLGYLPDDKHGRYFELHNSNDECELWTPAKRLPE